MVVRSQMIERVLFPTRNNWVATEGIFAVAPLVLKQFFEIVIALTVLVMRQASWQGLAQSFHLISA